MLRAVVPEVNVERHAAIMEYGALLTQAKAFAMHVLQGCRNWPETPQRAILCDKLLQAGLGVGANLRRLRRPATDGDWTAAIQAGLADLDEARYWMELAIESAAADRGAMTRLLDEARQLSRLFEGVLQKGAARKKERGPYLIYVG